jgi:DNA-binding response OmpR family regulator
MKTNQVLEKSVLVADNDAIVLESLAGKLRQFGFKVITASSGNDALNLFNKFYPDIVIIDEDLKEIDGLQLFLRLFFCNPLIKIILTTRDNEVIKNNELSDSKNFVVIKKRFSDDELKKIFKDVNFIPKTFQEGLQ